jgi:hypothetical protein
MKADSGMKRSSAYITFMEAAVRLVAGRPRTILTVTGAVGACA